MAVSPTRFPELTMPARAPDPGLGRAAGSGFAAVLKDAVGRVEAFHRQAGQEVERVLNGESQDLHGAILATQRADLAFELFSQVRSKIVQAYQEVMRMQM